MDFLCATSEIQIDFLCAKGSQSRGWKIPGCHMGVFMPDTITTRNSNLNIASFDPASDRRPLSPLDLLLRLGALMLVALCFGLAAQLLVGAP
jgi:hypothetical protein